MGVEDWSTDEALNLELDGADISRRASPGAPANELTRKIMADVAALSASVDERFENFVGENIEVDGITIENNDGTLTVKDVAIDGDTTDLLTAKIEEIEAAATQAGEDAEAAQTAATQAAASAASVETSVTVAATAANLAAQQADIAARAAARAQSGAAMAESAVQAVIAGTNLNWQKSEKASAVAIYPVPETLLEPTVDFLFSETGPASGDKSPNNPSTITGVSSVKVTRCGKNIVPYPFAETTKTSNGITWTDNGDGTVTANGTASALSAFFVADSSTSFSIPAGSYTLSGAPNGATQNAYNLYVHDANSSRYYDNDNGTSLQATAKIVGLNLRVASGATVSNIVFKPQLEVGSIATAFEPYDGADYAIDLGGTYYGGSIDLSTGLMTVTHVAVDPEAATVDISSAKAAIPLDYADTYGRTITSADGETLAVGSAGGTVVYRLAAPYTMQLSATQIFSLSQIDKFTPRRNSIYTASNSLQIGYVKSPVQSEYELTQAITATEGGE